MVETSTQIEPAVIARLISQAVLRLPDIARAAPVSAPGSHAPGVTVRQSDAGLEAECFLVTYADVRLPQLAAAVRLSAAGAAALGGASLRSVDVFVQDVVDRRG